ncbi:MAG TPA: hypothetical protein VF618_09015 [Thermoanaerobaculia bacterium]
MKVRILLVCTLLLLAAVPTFALPLCGHCNESNQCQSLPGDFERCRYDSATSRCYTTFERCSIPFTPSPVLTDWRVASIEISRPAPEAVTVPAAAELTEAAAPAAHATAAH